MTERLRARDLAFLTAETPASPRHNATVEVFDPSESGLDFDRLMQLIADRISFVPRYRQRVVAVPGHLAPPVWVDDEHFDLGYHVRRSALPRPGSDDQLRELVARIVSRPLDRTRPLWECYLVEGLEGDRMALLTKSHQALVDGVHTVDLGQLLLDTGPATKHLEPDDWRPRRTPSTAALLSAGVRDVLTDRATLVGTASAHRHAAFEACEFIVDWLKTKAPFWKREHTDAGTRWVEARASDTAALAHWEQGEAAGHDPSNSTRGARKKAVE